MIRAQNKIDDIMSAAYEQAFKVLEAEVKKFMRTDPRYVAYHHMVGWGPSFTLVDGSHIQWAHNMPTKKGRELMEFCDKFYDAHGAGNERVTL